MKTKLILLLLLLSICLPETIAQRKFHLGLEIGPRQEEITNEDPDKILIKNKRAQTIKGLNIAYELNKNYTIETGLYSIPRSEDVNLAGGKSLSYSSPDNMLQFPLRLNRNLISIGDKLKLRAIVGVSYVYNSSANCSTEECLIGTNYKTYSQEFPYFKADIYALNKHTFLVEGGASINYQIKPRIGMALTASYYHGNRPITHIYSTWQIDESTNSTAFSYSKGSSTNFLLKLSYQLFDFSKPKNQSEEYFKN